MDALERDFYEERRRKWRRSAFWRGFLVAAVLARAVVALARRRTRCEVGDEPRRALRGDRADRRRPRARRAAERHRRERQRAGGGAADQLAGRHHGGVGGAVRRRCGAVAAKKPVVAVLGEVAASGGYVAAIAADHIVARGNTLTGSIGVIMEYPDLTAGDGPARDRARDGALVGAQGRAVAVPADQPGGAGARRGAGGRELRLVPRPGRRAARASSGSGARRGGERRRLHRAAGAGERADRRDRRRARGDRLARIARGGARGPAGARLGGRARRAARGPTAWARSASTGGILGEISLSDGPKLYSIGP